MRSNEQVTAPVSILRRRQVEKRTGLSRSTLYEFLKAGRFPRPIRLGLRAVGWVESDIESWLQERIQAGRARS